MAKRRAGPRNGPMGCPLEDCSGGSAHRQHSVSDAIIDNITGEAQRLLRARKQSATRCSYCGAVYVRDGANTVLGKYDSGVLGQGWHPF